MPEVRRSQRKRKETEKMKDYIQQKRRRLNQVILRDVDQHVEHVEGENSRELVRNDMVDKGNHYINRVSGVEKSFQAVMWVWTGSTPPVQPSPPPAATTPTYMGTPQATMYRWQCSPQYT